jgi:hypothetical protein
MNSKLLGLLAVGTLAGPIAANAQITTLEYQSNALSGSSSYYNNPTPPQLLTPQQFAASFANVPFIGNITASFVIDEVGGDEILSGGVNVMGYNGKNIEFSSGVFAINIPDPSQLRIGNGFGTGTIDLIKSNGEITGATMDAFFFSYHGPSMYLVIGPSGDFVSYTYAGTNGPCTEQGSNEPNPCTFGGSSMSAGVWQVTQAPEIDPASTASGLTLLLGGVAVLRGRRTKLTPSV